MQEPKSVLQEKDNPSLLNDDFFYQLQIYFDIKNSHSNNQIKQVEFSLD